MLRRLRDSDNPLFLNSCYTDIHPLEVLCLNTGPYNCMVDHLPFFKFNYSIIILYSSSFFKIIIAYHVSLIDMSTHVSMYPFS